MNKECITLFAQARTLSYQKKFSDAIEVLKILIQKLPTNYFDTENDIRFRATLYSFVGLMYFDVKDYESAISFYKLALGFYEKYTHNEEDIFDSSCCYHNYGLALRMLRRFDEASKLLHQAVNWQLKISNLSQENNKGLARSYLELAICYNDLKKHNESQVYLFIGLRIIKELIKDTPAAMHKYSRYFFYFYSYIGINYLFLNDVINGKQNITRAVDFIMSQKLTDANRFKAASIYFELGYNFDLQTEHDKKIICYKTALTLLKSRTKKSNFDIKFEAKTHCNLGDVYCDSLDHARARNNYARAIEVVNESKKLKKSDFDLLARIYLHWQHLYAPQSSIEWHFTNFGYRCFKNYKANDCDFINTFRQIYFAVSNNQDWSQGAPLLSYFVTLLTIITRGYGQPDYPNTAIKKYLNIPQYLTRWQQIIDSFERERILPLLKLTASQPSTLMAIVHNLSFMEGRVQKLERESLSNYAKPMIK